MYGHPDSFLQPIIMRPEPPFNGEVIFENDKTHGWRVLSVTPCPNMSVRFPRMARVYIRIDFKKKKGIRYLKVTGDFIRKPHHGFCVRPNKLMLWPEKIGANHEQ